MGRLALATPLLAALGAAGLWTGRIVAQGTFNGRGPGWESEPNDRLSLADALGEMPAHKPLAVWGEIGHPQDRDEWFNFKVTLTGSDRPPIFLQGVDAGRFEDLDMLETDRAAARLRIVDGCGKVELLRPKRAVRIEYVVANDPHREPYKTEVVPAGTAQWSVG